MSQPTSPPTFLSPGGKPHAPACERNRDPILAVIAPLFAPPCAHVLEIGSGTGQHAVYFAARLPHLQWQCSDQARHLSGMRLWLDEAALPNTPPPLALDVSEAHWPALRVDAVFTANTLHYMPAESAAALLARASEVLRPGGLLVAYGPFNVAGRYTSESNARFDEWLRSVDPRFAIRDMGVLDDQARLHGLHRVGQHDMPAHNFCLVWQKQA